MENEQVPPQAEINEPALEQQPFVESIVTSTKQFSPKRSHTFWVVISSYILSFIIGFVILMLIHLVTGSTELPGVSTYNTAALRLGIPLAVFTTFLLSLIFPFLFAKYRKLLAMFLTLVLQFLTLIILIVIGLYQLAAQQTPELVLFT